MQLFGRKIACIELPVSDEPQTTWGDLALPDWLKGLRGVSDRLIAIAKNPEGFVLGALLSLLISGVLGLFKQIVEAFRILLVGSGVGYSPGELVGLEDLPLLAWSVIESPFSMVGDAILGAAAAPGTWAEGIAESMGIAAFPLTVGMYALIGIAVIELIRRSGRATIAAVPVLGTALEAFIYK